MLKVLIFCQSNDDKTWEKVYSVQNNQSDVSFIRLPEAEAKYIKINLIKSNADKGFGISEIKFLTIKESLTPNDFLIYSAKNSPVGNYPQVLSGTGFLLDHYRCK